MKPNVIEEYNQYFESDEEIKKKLIDKIQRQEEYIKYLEERTPIKSKIIYGDNREELQERIDKAIEHLSLKQIRFINEEDYILNDLDLDEIMQILQGSDKE